jgi:hypothetical protein
MARTGTLASAAKIVTILAVIVVLGLMLGTRTN